MKINVDEKIVQAKTPEERAAWEAQDREHLEKCDFVDGWYVGIFKQACGHWEVLQDPFGNVVELIAESLKRKCTRCVCGW